MSTKQLLITLGGLLLSLVAFTRQERDSYDWLWKDRKASAEALRALGQALSKPDLGDDDVLATWATFSRTFGLSVFTPSLGDNLAHPGRYFVEGSRYIIDANDVSAAGWRIRCPWVDVEASKKSDNLVTVDLDGVLLPASQPGVWFIGQRSVSQQPPAQDKLKETVVAISQGNGRLILVDLSGKSGVAVLPYGVQ